MSILSLFKAAPRRTLIGGATATALAVSTITGFEGERLTTYRDVVGIPTYCIGETKDAKMGRRYTHEECADKLVTRLVDDFEPAIVKCVPAYDRLPERTRVAALSLSYNIGTGGFCRSSVARYFNAGQLRAACGAFGLYTRAGGRVIKGLVDRRAKETKMCLEGIA